MLVVIDMQNHILDPSTHFYIPGIETLIPKIANRISQARDAGEYILYTQDIPIEVKDTEKEEQYELQLIKDINPRPTERVFKKYYFSLSPEKILEIQNELKEKTEAYKKIEIVGVETSLCVLANTLKLQSAFPEAKIIVPSTLTTGRKYTEEALDILKEFNVDIQ